MSNYKPHHLSGEEEPGLVGELRHHVGVLGVGQVEAAVAVRQVLQVTSPALTSRWGFLSVITGIFPPDTTPTEVTTPGLSLRR